MMRYDTESLIKTVPNYHSFLTLNELDARAHELAKKYTFPIQQVGVSEHGHPLYMITAGQGTKNAFVWGFPHPNEPIGSLMIDWLLDYFGKNPEFLKKTGYTWHCMVTADPDGTKMNEGWFKGPFTLKNYFNNFFRPMANRMIDWTFPIRHNDFEWNKPLAETEILANLLDSTNPDLMYPLHNTGFGGAYFLTTRESSEDYYEKARASAKKAGIPLHLGEPEEDFMKELSTVWYRDFSFKDYYDHCKSIGKDPVKALEHGDNSTGYLLRKNPDAVVIKAEVPYFYSKLIENQTPSEKKRREVWIDFLDTSKNHAEIVKPLLPTILQSLPKSSMWYPYISELMRLYSHTDDAMRTHVLSSAEFDRNATEAEVFDGAIGSFFYNGGLRFGPIKRAAHAAGLEAKILNELNKHITACEQAITNTAPWHPIPIRNLVHVQAALLFNTLNELEQ